MIKNCTRSLLLSSKIILRQYKATPLNKFVTLKCMKSTPSGLFINNNAFGFAELPKHKVLNVS